MESMDPAELEAAMAAAGAFIEELVASGAFVFAAGLHPPSTATTVNHTGEAVVLASGPYVEAAEYLGGFWVIDAADQDAAVAWAAKASKALPGPPPGGQPAGAQQQRPADGEHPPDHERRHRRGLDLDAPGLDERGQDQGVDDPDALEREERERVGEQVGDRDLERPPTSPASTPTKRRHSTSSARSTASIPLSTSSDRGKPAEPVGDVDAELHAGPGPRAPGRRPCAPARHPARRAPDPAGQRARCGRRGGRRPGSRPRPRR